jgi:alpha-mannosidase
MGVVLSWLVFIGMHKAPVFVKGNGLLFTSEVKPWYKHRKDGKAGREVVLHIGGRLTGKIAVTIDCNGKEETTETQVKENQDTISVLLPEGAGQKATEAKITLRANNDSHTITVNIPAKKQWTVYIYPHAHLDIGYTNLQETVKKLQMRNIDVGIDLAQKTQHYPEGARFVWNPEATWIVSNYLKNASAEKRKKLIDAVKKGWVQIDGAHSNMNTSICTGEELMRMFRSQQNIQRITGVPITTMVQFDNPGGSWGLIQAAVQNGIKGFISFPNTFDLRKTWEHKPFYWIAPDGKSKLLFLQATPYGIGYTLKGSKYGLGKVQSFNDTCDRLHTATPMKNFIDPFIFEETAKLEKANSPYDIMAITWSMADNCLIDADLPEAVKQWNATYAYPKLIIAGSKEILQAYESRYSNIIPSYSGDYTEFWTDGLGSDAKRVALSQHARENMVQAETLWALLDPGKAAPINEFHQGWEDLLLAAEHTWGAQNPGTPLAAKIEGNKAAYFENAEKISRRLIEHALEPIKDENSNTIAVINTLSWPRSGLVVLNAQQSKAGDKVLDDANREVPAQRLTSGELIFQSDNIPALSSKTYKVVAGKCNIPGGITTGPFTLQNGKLAITIDEKTGSIKSMIDVKNNRELVNASAAFQLNSFNYVPGVWNGRDSSRGSLPATDISVRVKEQGPLVTSLLITSKAPGCNWLTREVRLIKDEAIVECINTIDKLPTRKKEAIHYGFAFNVPAGNVQMDIPWGIMRPEQDQLPGANRNWLAFQHWIDVSNKEFGITWTALESPVVELGSITGTILDGARQVDRWIKKSAPTQTILSWPVNNHWNTNFPPEQQGIITERYCMAVHEKYDAAAANRFGMEQNRPLIAVQTKSNPIKKSLISLDNPKVMISALKRSDDNQALIVRLRSLSNKTEKFKIGYPAKLPQSVFTCTVGEKPLQQYSGSIELPKYGTISLRMVFNNRVYIKKHQ